MAISTTANRKSFSGDGTTTAFYFPYSFFANTDLVVILKNNTTGVETTQTITTHYTVAGGNGASGTVTMLVSPPAGTTLTVYNDPAATQGLDLVENDSLPAESVERAFDRVTLLAQRLKDRADRTVRLSEGFAATFDPSLPALLEPDRVLKVNSDGDGFALGPSEEQVEDAEAFADAAEASSVDASQHATTASRWAKQTGATVVDADTGADSGEYSAKEYATGTTINSARLWAVGDIGGAGGSAKDWATKTGAAVSGGEFSAKNHAQNAAASAIDAAAAATTAANAVVATHAALTTTHGVAGTIVGTTDTQTLTNKTLTNPKMGTAVDYAEQGSNPAAPGVGYRRLFFKSDGKLYQEDSGGNVAQVGGSSAGGINYILNPDAETDANGWAAYADAAGVAIVDGTGGSPNTTISRSTSSPLRGVGMFRITKSSGASRQGEGVSYDFTIAAADKAKPLTISFEYSPSVNVVAGSDTTTGDFNVYIYDVTNATVIQPTPFKLTGGAGGIWKYSGVFQTSATSTSYRLCIHTAGTTSAFATLDFDNVVVGPQVQLYGAPVSEWQSYTPTLNSNTGVSASGFQWRRIGDSMQVGGYILYNGTGAATNLTVSLPAGYSHDVNKNPGGAGTLSHVGEWGWYDAAGSVASRGGFCYVSSNNFNFLRSDNSSDLITNLLATSDRINFLCTVPIVGWGSNTLMSSDADTRVVALELSGSTTALSTTTATIVPTTVVRDTHGGWSTGSNGYVAPLAGFYRIESQIRGSSVAWPATSSFFHYYSINGGAEFELDSRYTHGAQTYPMGASGSTITYLNAGDIVRFRTYSGISCTTTAFRGAISRLSGPSAIAASELVALHSQTGAGQSITNSGSFVTLLFGTKLFDTHSAYNTTTGVFTCPAAGKYYCSATILWDQLAWAANNYRSIAIFKNGSEIFNAYEPVQAAGTYFLNSQANGILTCNAGDTIEFKARNTRTAGATTLNVGVMYNHCSIARIGL